MYARPDLKYSLLFALAKCSIAGLSFAMVWLDIAVVHTEILEISFTEIAQELMLALCAVLFDLTTAIYSAIYVVFQALFLDRVHQQNISVQMLIFTKENNPELPRFIMDKLDRGVTYWTAHGAYTGDEVQVLCVCLSKYEVGTLQQVMQEIDPKAFFIVQEGIRTGGNYRRHLN